MLGRLIQWCRRRKTLVRSPAMQRCSHALKLVPRMHRRRAAAGRVLSVEPLEDRRLLSAAPVLSAGLTATPSFLAYSPAGEFAGVQTDSSGSANPSGLTPTQLRGAYGLGTYTWNSNTDTGTLSGGISFGSIPGLARVRPSPSSTHSTIPTH